MENSPSGGTPEAGSYTTTARCEKGRNLASDGRVQPRPEKDELIRAYANTARDLVRLCILKEGSRVGGLTVYRSLVLN
jgi:hypothetical protein